MRAVLEVTTPFFALVLCGYLAWHFRVLAEEAVRGMNAFVLFFALPCLLFRYGASLPIGQLINPAVLIVYATAALVMVLFTVTLTLSRTVSIKDAAFSAMVAASPNTGFMGVPLLIVLLGPAATGPAISSIVVDLILTSTLCLVLAQFRTGPNVASTARIIQVFRGVTANPLPWAIALGALSRLLELHIVEPIDNIIKLLGDAATPMALFTIGGVLWRARRHSDSRPAMQSYMPVAAIKIFFHPALVFGLGFSAQHVGLPLSNSELTALTLVAALPSASNVSLLAERLGADNGRIAHIILASTVFAFGSFSFFAFLLV